MITIQLICDTLAFKVVTINGSDYAASGLIFPLGFLFASIITDVYGFTLAGRVIWVQLICQAVFILIVNLFVLLPSPVGSEISLHYLSLYHELWHVLIASTCAVVVAYFINDFVMSQLKIYLSGKYFIIRFLFSNAIGNLFLVSIAYPINFYNLYPIDHIAVIAINTWLYKMVFAILLFPLAIILANFFKRIEKLDYFDYGVSYNPMMVFSENDDGENKFLKKRNTGSLGYESYPNN